MSQSKLQVLLCRLHLAPSRGDPVNSYFSIRLFLSSLPACVSLLSSLPACVSLRVLYCLLFCALYCTGTCCVY